MELKVRKHLNQLYIRLPTEITKLLSSKKQDVSVNGINFTAIITFENYLKKDGNITKTGMTTIPSKISDYLKLKNGDNIQFEIL